MKTAGKSLGIEWQKEIRCMKTWLDEQMQDSLWICQQQGGCVKYIKQKKEQKNGRE